VGKASHSEIEPTKSRLFQQSQSGRLEHPLTLSMTQFLNQGAAVRGCSAQNDFSRVRSVVDGSEQNTYKCCKLLSSLNKDLLVFELHLQINLG
jgi:hypothetical protein